METTKQVFVLMKETTGDIYTVLSIISVFATLFGKSIPEFWNWIKRINEKDRHAIDCYVIKKTLKDEPIQVGIRRIRTYIIELCKVIAIYFIFIYEYIMCRMNGNIASQEDFKCFVYILNLFILCIMVRLIKRQCDKKSKIIVIFGALAFAVFSWFQVEKYDLFQSYYVIPCLVALFYIEMFCEQIEFWKDYNCFISRELRGIRYCLVLTACLTVRNAKKPIEYMAIYMIIWLGICYLEYLFVIFSEQRFNVKVKIKTDDVMYITQKKIIQYKNGKIEIKLLNGTKQDIEKIKVNEIEYEMKGYRYRNVNKNKVQIVMKDGEKRNFHGQSYISGEWHYLYELDNGVKRVTILPDRIVDCFVDEGIIEYGGIKGIFKKWK